MWNRFSEQAKQAIVFAQEEAAKLNDTAVSTEHLLLGVLRETDAEAARILKDMGVPLSRVKADIERRIVHGDSSTTAQKVQLMPRTKHVIELAYQESKLLRDDYIGTEHLLLGIICEGEGLAARILANLGITLAKARIEAGYVQDAPGGRRPPCVSPTERTQSPITQPIPHKDKVHIWQGLSDQAKNAMLAAQQEAVNLGESFLDTEHILLGLINDEKNVSRRILNNLGHSPEKIRIELMKQIPRGNGRVGQNFQITTRVAKIVDIAREESALMQCKFIGTEHLLFGLLAGKEGLGYRILTLIGIKLDGVRAESKRLHLGGEDKPVTTS
jgi:ATP-dependent Clp protease ATP-binding subunit ClpA